MEALELLGLDDNWRKAVIALCAQENAIRKKLEVLGEKPDDLDFQKVAALLEKKIIEEGQDPPDILLSLARAYPHIRGKLVHAGYKKSIDPREVDSIVINTIGLLEILFEVMPTELNQFHIAESLLELDDMEARLNIEKLNSSERKAVFIALIEKYALSELGIEKEKIKKILLVIIKSKIGEINILLDIAIQRYGSVTPSLALTLLGKVAHLPSVLDFVKEMSHADWVVSCFAGSGNYNEAANISGIIAKISSILTDSQIEAIFSAIMENSQIYDSWGAKRKLSELVDMHWKEEENPFTIGKKDI